VHVVSTRGAPVEVAASLKIAIVRPNNVLPELVERGAR
jgi:hypothetical protein